MKQLYVRFLASSVEIFRARPWWFGAVWGACLAAGFPTGAQTAAPAVTVQPVSQVVVAGDTATFSVSAQGDAPTYQWLLDGGLYPGATNAVLTLTNVSAKATGAYTARVANAAGTVESQFARLTVVNPIRLDARPVAVNADEGQSVAFAVAPEASSTNNYQWRLGNSPISGQTNTVLLLTNLTAGAAGDYSVSVTNTIGASVAGPGVLIVRPSPSDRTLRLGLVRDGARVQVPAVYFSRGDEQGITFSVSFDPSVLTNGLFQSNPLQVATTNGIISSVAVAPSESRASLSAGLYGVSLATPTHSSLNAGYQMLGAFRFDLVAGAEALNSHLAFTNQPVETKVTDTNGASLTLVAEVPAQWSTNKLSDPTLDRQSGLFEQSLEVNNPGAASIPFVRLLVRGLGMDSLTNQIRVYNATGSTNNVPYVEFGPLAAGATQRLTLEYYVADRRSAFHPQFELQTLTVSTFAAPNGSALSITSSRFVKGTFLIQFPTRAGHRYFVQYVSGANDFSNASALKTAQPSINGTGSEVQWIDNGPPKTDGPPLEGNRFYRVLETN